MADIHPLTLLRCGEPDGGPPACDTKKEVTVEGPEGEYEAVAHCLLDLGHDGPHRDGDITWNHPVQQ